MELPCHKLDLWGYPVHTASDSCIASINSYYQEVLAYGSNQKIIFKAAQEDSKCVLALVLAALHSLRSSSEDAQATIATSKSCLLDATPYERMALMAAEALVKEQWDAALTAYSKLLDQYPRDLFSLKRVQVLCFYMGKSEESLSLSSKVLPSNKEEVYIYGMHAFALLETHRFDEAEQAARKALSIKNTDKWAQHALCHVLQYRCLFREAVQFMEKNTKSWDSCCSFMYSHNWWHLAVCYLEWGSKHALDKVMEIYDTHLWPARCQDLGASVQASLSALGLLLRLEVRGLTDCVHERIVGVAQQLRDSTLWHKERLLDLLAVWALAHVGQSNESYAALKQLESRVNSGNHKEQENLKMFLKVAEGLHEYGRRNFTKAFDLLGPSFKTDKLKVIGASDEQLDVFEELWCIVSLRSGHFQEVSGVLKKRLHVFKGSSFTLELMEEFYNRTGNPDEARIMASQAGSIKKSYLSFVSH